MTEQEPKFKVPLIKTGERAWGGRIYSPQSVITALGKFKWDATIPLVGKTRSGDNKEEHYLRKTDFDFDEETGILYVLIPERIKHRVFGRSLAPYILVNRVIRGKETATIMDFTLQAVQITDDLCSFPSINSTVS